MKAPYVFLLFRNVGLDFAASISGLVGLGWELYWILLKVYILKYWLLKPSKRGSGGKWTFLYLKKKALQISNKNYNLFIYLNLYESKMRILPLFSSFSYYFFLFSFRNDRSVKFFLSIAINEFLTEVHR